MLAPMLLLIGAGAGAAFDPPTGVTYRYTVTETRDYGGGRHSFTNNRRVRFDRMADGLTADLTPGDSDASGADEMFLAGMSGLRGRTLRYRIDGDGRVIAIDDAAAHWQAFLSGIDSIGAGTGPLATARHARTTALAGQLRLLPAAGQQRLLASLLAPIIGLPLPATADPAPRPITVSATDPEGHTVRLDGTERVTREPGDVIRVETHAEGDLAASATRPTAHLSVERSRRIDTRTGLVLSSAEHRETVIGDGAKARRSTVSGTSTLTAVL